MNITTRQNTIYWTLHSRAKMRQYKLSPQRILRILHSPKRVEEGVAPKTFAAMQPILEMKNAKGEVVWKQELWVMAQDAGKIRKIISAWRYPGVSKLRSEFTKQFFRAEYDEYITAAAKEIEEKDKERPKINIGLKWRGDLSANPKPVAPKRFWPAFAKNTAGKPKRPWSKRSLKKSASSQAIQLE